MTAHRVSRLQFSHLAVCRGQDILQPWDPVPLQRPDRCRAPELSPIVRGQQAARWSMAGRRWTTTPCLPIVRRSICPIRRARSRRSDSGRICHGRPARGAVAPVVSNVRTLCDECRRPFRLRNDAAVDDAARCVFAVHHLAQRSFHAHARVLDVVQPELVRQLAGLRVRQAQLQHGAAGDERFMVESVETSWTSSVSALCLSASALPASLSHSSRRLPAPEPWKPALLPVGPGQGPSALGAVARNGDC